MDLEAVTRGLIFDVLKKRLVGIIVSKAAFLAYPPFSWVLGYFLDKILKALYTEGRLNVKYAAIDAETAIAVGHAEDAKAELDSALKKGKENEIAIAKEKFRERYGALIRLQP